MMTYSTKLRGALRGATLQCTPTISYSSNVRRSANLFRGRILLFSGILLTLFSACGKSSDEPVIVDPPMAVLNKIEYTGTANLSEARSGLAAAAAGSKIVFAGGQIAGSYSKTVDIYDINTNTWSTAQLSEARYLLAAAAAGNKIVFAGGESATADNSRTVDIYDVNTNTWTTAQLSAGRRRLASASLGNKLLVAGGSNDAGDPSKVVDVYDNLTKTWSTSLLSEAKSHCFGAAAINKVVFAGNSKIADIYNVSTGAWNVFTMSESKYDCAAAAAGTKIVFAGGQTEADLSANPPKPSVPSRAVDVYDAVNNNWATFQLSEGRSLLAGAATGNKMLFAGGDNATGYSKVVDIFTLSVQ